ncbi:MAG TPA: prepilin-type N-terminal cleavage/methylation domain-containing protein [Acidimicrobiia bacterium]|jgi:Tfp pilus assembly protein PilX
MNRLVARARRRQDGFALIAVMISTTILALLAAGIVAYGVGSMSISRHDENWNAALAAAEAGVDDYVYRLNANGNYWLYSAANPPPDNNQAFAGWQTVPGGGTVSQYHYTVDASSLAVNGTLKLTSTGRVNGTMRTAYATLRQRSFLDYLYFTDYETVDPALYTGSPFTAAQAQVACAKYAYGSNPRDSNCQNIQFISGDTINGPLHTNDAFMVCGNPHFNGDTSTSWSGSGGLRYRDGCPTSHPVFANPGDPQTAPPLTMPPSDATIKSQTNAGAGGCLYTGPTRIKLNSNGTMTVNSPFSKNTNNSSCPLSGNTGPLPSDGVIFVQNVPSTTTDPNYTNGCPYSVNGRSHPLGMPIANDITTYGCRNGDAFVEGTLKGQLTIATDNSVVVTWNITYASGLNGTDLLGLIANNNVEIYHPVSCTSGTTSSCNLNANFPGETARNATFQNPQLYAAALSVNHSVRVQNNAIGSPLGTLSVRGAFSQRYRGAVGTNSSGTIVSGYAKDYTYDQRLHYESPPHFLDPIASQWQEATWAELKTPAGLPA